MPADWRTQEYERRAVEHERLTIQYTWQHSYAMMDAAWMVVCRQYDRVRMCSVVTGAHLTCRRRLTPRPGGLHRAARLQPPALTAALKPFSPDPERPFACPRATHDSSPAQTGRVTRIGWGIVAAGLNVKRLLEADAQRGHLLVGPLDGHQLDLLRMGGPRSKGSPRAGEQGEGGGGWSTHPASLTTTVGGGIHSASVMTASRHASLNACGGRP